jgi:arabinosyltransferase C
MTFLASAFAWGMTLRPEPFTALFVTSVFACAVAFSTTAAAAALALAIGLIPLAMTGHHAGLLAAAPVIAIGSPLIAWVRRNPAAATALATTGFALLLLFAFLGADVSQRSLDAAAIRTYGVPDAWFDELRRYARLSDFHGGPPLRRVSFALMALAVLAYLTRRGRTRHGVLELPSTSLAISLTLLIAVPSKWPWHFGALLGVAAIAVAVETYRIRSDEPLENRWDARWLLAVGAVTVAAAWSWGPRQPWTLLDLSTLDWTPNLPLSLPMLAVTLAPLLLVGMIVVSSMRGRSPSDAPRRVAYMAAPIVTVPIVVFTVGLLTADAARSDWTLAKQNIDTVRASGGCGLADTILVPDPTSMRPAVTKTMSSIAERVPEWLPQAPLGGLRRYALEPRGTDAASSPWLRIYPDAGFFLAAAGARGGVAVEWGRKRTDRVVRLGSKPIHTAIADGPGATPWRFVTARELGDRPKQANVARVTLRTDDALGSFLGVTVPVRYRVKRFAELLKAGNAPALVSPAFRVYMPCANLPSLGDGLVEAPHYIVSPNGVWLPDPGLAVGYRTSPFGGVSDLYAVERLSTADSRIALPINVWRVETGVPGGRVLPAVQRLVTS